MAPPLDLVEFHVTGWQLKWAPGLNKMVTRLPGLEYWER